MNNDYICKKTKNMKRLFDFDDVLIEPAINSDINSRGIINIFDKHNYLPLMTAPMDTVVDINNASIYNAQKITSVIPRAPKTELTHVSTTKSIFYSYGLIDFENIFIKNSVTLKSDPKYALIDVANGHMKDVLTLCQKAKQIHGDNLVLMVGNIANPNTLHQYIEANVDYVRVGIGAGQGCWDENTLIKTINGYKKIKDVEINDFVLTHTGEYKEVINKISYETENDLIKINGEICTADHEIYVINKSDVNFINDDNYIDYAFFIEAKNVDEENHLLLSWEL